jgi:AcrR family transcriptional regulator
LAPNWEATADSRDELLTQTLERFVDQLADALEALYDDPDLTFAEKWRLGAQFWVEEPTPRFPKILLELLAIGWSKPDLRARLTEVHARFRVIFERHFGQALRDYGVDEEAFPLKVMVAAVTSFQLDLIVEGLSEVETGHKELLDWIQTWIDGLEAARTRQAS